MGESNPSNQSHRLQTRQAALVLKAVEHFTDRHAAPTLMYLGMTERKREMRFLTLYLLCTSISCGCFTLLKAGTIDPRVSDLKYLSYGQRHKCVALITGDMPTAGSTARLRASAVIFKPKIVITAAHVIDGSEKMQVTLGTQKSNVVTAIYPNKWDKKSIGPCDLALCVLDKPIQLDFYPELYSGKDEFGKVCSIAGYGITGDHQNGVQKKDNKKRAGSNVIDKNLFNGMLVCSINSRPKTSLEFLISHGDSGGGLFVDGKLAGINSAVMTKHGGELDSDYNDQSCHTRISVHKDWLDKVIKELGSF